MTAATMSVSRKKLKRVFCWKFLLSCFCHKTSSSLAKFASVLFWAKFMAIGFQQGHLCITWTTQKPNSCNLTSSFSIRAAKQNSGVRNIIWDMYLYLSLHLCISWKDAQHLILRVQYEIFCTTTVHFLFSPVLAFSNELQGFPGQTDLWNCKLTRQQTTELCLQPVHASMLFSGTSQSWQIKTGHCCFST